MDNNRDENQLFTENEVDLYTLVHDIVVNWWVVLLGGIAAALLCTVFINMRYQPEYTTRTTFVVVAKTDNGSYSNLSSANTMATAFQKVLESTVMRKTVKEQLGMDLEDVDIQTSLADGTNLMTLSVTADNPKDAVDVIHTIMDNYSSVSLYTVGNAVMEVLESPRVPYAPDNPLDVAGPRKKAFLFGALAVILLLGAYSYLSNTVKQEKEIERKLDARSLGEISYEWKYKTIRSLIRHKKKAALVDDPVAGFRFVESYKKLATKVQYQMKKKDQKVLVVTSAAENEGKSTVAANLAITLAEQSKKVILIDGDIRKPSQYLILGVPMEEKNELTEYFRGSGMMKEILLSTNRKYLRFIGGKKKSYSSTEILQTERLGKLINACREVADYVIIDTPPTGLIGDAQIFADQADAVLLVVRQNYVLAEDINEVLDEFRDHGGHVLGVVLNGVQQFSSLTEAPVGNYYGRYSRYGRYGGYGAYGRSAGASQKESSEGK